MSLNSRKLAETCFSWDHKAVDFRDALTSALNKQSQVVPPPWSKPSDEHKN